MKEEANIKEFDLLKLAVIVVTYNPEMSILERQFRSIPNHSLIIVVDNNSNPEIRDRLKKIVKKNDRFKLLLNEENLGLARAINQGGKWAYQHGYTMLLMLDQDTEPDLGSIQKLLGNYKTLLRQGKVVGCVGPRLIDEKTNLNHGFHKIKGLKWSRIYPENKHFPFEISSINGSGTLVSSYLFHQMGGLDENFFIDHVDTEWSFRVLAAGYKLYGIPNTIFKHRMGDESIRFWLFGWKVWPYRSPNRHYYLFRNAVVLMKRGYVPKVWKFWLILKLLITIGVHLISDPRRYIQVENMIKGIKEGLQTH